jgi:uncharacterized protein YbjT (DUF2867 family)
VRTSSRSRETLEARGWPAVEIVPADALAPETLPAALQDVEVAYYLVHSMAAGAISGVWTWKRPATLPMPPHRPACDASSISADWCRTMP